MPTLLLIIGLVLNGLMAGLYFGFTTAVMPGLARGDARAYVASMQRIDQAILNPAFLLTFMGALVVPIVAALLHLDDGGRARLPWIVAAAVVYGITLVTTQAVNIPLNRQIVAVGAVTDERVAAAARSAFHGRWSRFNTLRTVLATVSTIALAVALSLPLG